ncbi:MAG: hypothetical protein ACM3XM_20375 [Mycobacterium leprae]
MPAFVAPSITCLSGTVRPAPEIDFIQRGTHRLVNDYGAVVATLSAKQVNLTDWVGQSVTVCGIDEGIIEGVHSLQVTQVLHPGELPPSGRPSPSLMMVPLLVWLPLPWLIPLWVQNKKAEP